MSKPLDVASPTTLSAPPPTYALIFMALAPFSLGYLFSYLYRAANAVVSGDLVRELNLTASELGLLTGAYLAAFAAFQLPLGVLLDRYGPRRVQAALVAFGAAGALLFAFGRDVATLTVARAMIGIAFSGGLMSCFKAVVIWVSEPRRALANACLMSLGGIGLLIATTPLELMVREWGWRSVFMGMSAVTLFVAVLIIAMVPERGFAVSTERLSVQIRQIGSIYSDRVFLALAPLLATTAGTHIAIQTLWVAPWFRDIVGLDSLGVANSLFVMAAAFVVSILLAGVITDVLVRRGVSLVTVTLGFISIFLSSQVALLFNPSDHRVALGLWCIFGMTGHVAVISYPWLARYFGQSLSGRSNTAANLLMFLWAFVVQYGAGGIIGLFPTRADGGYVPEAYQAAFGGALVVQLLALLWYLANRRRIKAVG
ncbi:MAG: MFS transporter [Hyphomicrobiaceae bacterium]